jgi:multidrug efflux system membrane fusion protein
MSFSYQFALSVPLAALILNGCGSPKAQSAPAMPPVPVSVAVAAQESLPVDIRAIGSVEPFDTVQVKSQIAGELMSVHFTEGGNVNQGDLLFEIDPRPYRDTLRQAEANLNRDQAQLRQAEANLARDTAQSKFTEADAARNQELSKLGVVARSQSDQIRANSDALLESMRADRAAIESAKAALDSDRTSVDRAKLDLTYCEIRSPISGRAGNLLVHAGNYVKSNGDTTLVVINRLRPIFVTFGVPEDRLAAIRQGESVRKLAVQVTPQDSAGKVAQGVLSVIDNTVDTTTGTIKLKATVPNEAGLLWPGQFVNVSLRLDTLRNAITVPAEAVQPGARGQFVYVVKPDQTVESRDVTVGATVGRKAIVEKGVAPGETVVVDGQLRLYPGARIQPVPAAKVDSQQL